MIAGADKRGLVTLLLIGAVCAFVVSLYSSSFATMADLWQRSDHMHGVLVFPIAAYLLWRSRDALARIELKPWAWGVLAVAPLVALWFVSRAIGVQATEHLAAVLLIPAAVATLLGISLAWRAMFPLLFLVIAVPIGDTLIPILMRITADLSAALVRSAGVPVLREGQFMTLPGGAFEVADVCAGLRYLISGTMTALLFAYLTYAKQWKRAVFVAVTAVTLVVANGVRAAVVMLVASASNMRYFAGRDHVYFGWLLFGAVVILLFWIGARFADTAGVREAEALHTAERREASHLLPLVFVLGLVMLATTARPFEEDLGSTWILLVPAGALLLWALYKKLERVPMATRSGTSAGVSTYRRAAALMVVAVAGSVLAAGPVLSSRSVQAVASAQTPDFALPKISSCEPPAAWALSWQPEIEAPDFAASAMYRCLGHAVNAFVAGYDNNVQGKELVSDSHELVPTVWRRFAERRKHRFDAGGRTIEVNEVALEGPGLRSLVWYWYGVGDRTATGSTGVKLLQALQLITQGRSSGALYLLETPLDATTKSSRERLQIAARNLVTAVHDERRARRASDKT